MQHIDHRVVDRLRVAIPPGQTFYVTASTAAAPIVRHSVAYWLGYALLPRIRVRDPASAQWIVGWNRNPRLAAPHVGRVIGVSPLEDADRFYLGRVS